MPKRPPSRDLHLSRSFDEPRTQYSSWHERWYGEDLGIISCWEIGRSLRTKSPDLARQVERGELPMLAWKGGIDPQKPPPKKKPPAEKPGARKKLGRVSKEQSNKIYGSLNYLALWQGLKGKDLDIYPNQESELTCSKTGVTVTYTLERAKYLGPEDIDETWINPKAWRRIKRELRKGPGNYDLEKVEELAKTPSPIKAHHIEPYFKEIPPLWKDEDWGFNSSESPDKQEPSEDRKNGDKMSSYFPNLLTDPKPRTRTVPYIYSAEFATKIKYIRRRQDTLIKRLRDKYQKPNKRYTKLLQEDLASGRKPGS